MKEETKRREEKWAKFHKWEKEYENEKLRRLTPTERLRILDDLYLFTQKIREEIKKKR